MGHFAGRAIVTDGIIFQVDAANKLCGNVTNAKNIVNPTETGTFNNGASVVDNAYTFDGTDDYIEYDNTLGNFSITDSFSIECWINVVTDGTDRVIVARYSSGNRGYMMRVTSTDTIRFGVTDDGGKYRFSDTSVLQDGWNYVVGTWDGTDAKSYINGDLDSTEVYNGTLTTISTSEPLFIGKASDYGSVTDGLISSVKIYNRELTQSEVTQNYEATKYRFI
jgi:hypothetical protein